MKEEIKQLRKQGLSYEEIGKKFNLSRQRIHQIITGYLKAYYQRPEVKAKRRAYNQRPEIKAKIRAYDKAYRQRPEVKAKRSAYFQIPEIKAKVKAYHKAYYLKKKNNKSK